MRVECIRKVRAFVGNSDQDTTVVQNATGWTIAFKSGSVADYQCWPDTVDPARAEGEVSEARAAWEALRKASLDG